MMKHIFIGACIWTVLSSTWAGPSGQPVIPPDRPQLSQFVTHGDPTRGEGAIVEVEGQQVWQVTMHRKLDANWKSNLSTPNLLPIGKGDVITIRFRLRSLTDEPAVLEFNVQDNADNYKSLVKLRPTAGRDWVTVETNFTAEKDHAPRELGFNLFTGAKKQSFQMAGMEVLNFGPGATADDIARNALPDPVSFDFESGFRPITAPDGSSSQISGTLPKGWTEDSGWADVDVTHGPSASGEAGTQGWRIEVGEIRGGFAQIRLDGFPADPQTYTRLKIAFRSPTSTVAQIAVRKAASPYTSYWEGAGTANPEWRMNEFLIPPLPKDPKAQLVIAIKQPGVIEVDSVSLEFLTPAMAGKGTSFEGNLLPHSSLPFGLHAPWTAHWRHYQPGDYQPDPDHPGPTGVPSLRIDGNGHEQHLVTAFRGKGGAPHTLSVWAKASKPDTELSLRMGPPREKLYTSPWNSTRRLSTEWKRYSFTTRLPITASGFYQLELRMRSPNTQIWLDGLMVETGSSVGEFQRTDPIELSLHSTTEAAPFCLHFPEEPLQLKLRGIGQVPEEARLLASIKFYSQDEAFELPPEILPAGEIDQKIIDFSGQPLPEFGSYLAQVQIVDANGEPLTRVHERLLHRVRRPHHLGETVTDSPFGVHVTPQKSSYRMAKRLGFNWVRIFQLEWMVLQPDGPEQSFLWDNTDPLMEAAREARLSVLAPLGATPRWANFCPPDFKGWRSRMFMVRPEHLDSWEHYCREVLGRYQGTLNAVETWNEPFWPAWFIRSLKEDGSYQQASPEDFMVLSQRVRKAVDTVSPGVEVIWNSGVNHSPEFDRAIADLGAFDLIDSLSYHSYETNAGGFPGDKIQQIAGYTVDLMKEYHGDMPVYNTEGGPGGGHFHFIYEHGPARETTDTEMRYSQYAVRSFVTMMAAGVDRFFIYQFSRGTYWRPDYDLMHGDGTLAPNQVAFSNMAWHFEDKNYVKTIPVGEGWHAFLFGNEEDSAALLVPKGTAPLSLNPMEGVTVSSIYGNTLDLPGAVRLDTFLHAPGKTAADFEAALVAAVSETPLPLVATDASGSRHEQTETQVPATQ